MSFTILVEIIFTISVIRFLLNETIKFIVYEETILFIFAIPRIPHMLSNAIRTSICVQFSNIIALIISTSMKSL